LTEDKAENKLVDTPKHKDEVKRKGYKSFEESLENQKEELEKILESRGIVTKKEDVLSSDIDVVSLSKKKDKPLEIEDEKDNFFIKPENQPSQQIQPKKKKN